MTNSSPSYITKNKFGVYYFQYSLKIIRSDNNSKYQRVLYRKSLRTKERRKALLLSRFLWLAMTKIEKKYFSNVVDYQKAMGLLAQYEAIQCESWEDAQKFFDELDDITSSDSLYLEFAEKEKINEIALHSYHQFTTNNSSFFSNSENLKDENLSILVEKWLEIKNQQIKKTSFISAKQRIIFFQEQLLEFARKDLNVSEITFEMIDHYVERLKSKAKFEKSANNSLIGLQTIKAHLTNTSEFFDWIVKRFYKFNSQCSVYLKTKKEDLGSSESKEKEGFTSEELKKIFTAKAYLEGTYSRSADYWIKLIALFTGARLSEIAQLELDDIKQVTGTWCFDINEDGDDKSIKKKTSKRVTVIHEQLIKLGIIDYVNLMRKKKYTRLFPNELKNEKSGKFGATTQRINRSIQALGIVDKGTHTFRHTIKTIFDDLAVDNSVSDSICGWASSSRSVGDKHYSHTHRIELQKKAMDLLKFDIDFSNIQIWNKCKFMKTENLI